MQSRSTLSLIVPSRHRLRQLTAFCDSIVATAREVDAIELVLIADADDENTVRFADPRMRIKTVVVQPGQRMGALNQAGYEASTGERIMLLNDDVIARTRHWDQRVNDCFRDYRDGILLVHVNDTLMRQNLCTFPLVSRPFCQLAGGICPTEYHRYRIDDHVEDVFNLLHAMGQRRTIYLPQVIFEHTNSVLMPQGHREYHARPDLLAVDEPLFLNLFPLRKELALRLLERIAPQDDLQARRRQLEAIIDPFTLRTADRQLVRGRLGPSLWQRGVNCWRRRGIRGFAEAIERRLRIISSGR